jgi:hypothetical protein
MARYDEFGGVLHAAGSDALSRDELGCLLAGRGGLDVGALPKASKASVGAKGTTMPLTRRRRMACWPRSCGVPGGSRSAVSSSGWRPGSRT